MMKKITIYCLILTSIFLSSGIVNAQEEVLIKKTDWGDYTDIKYAILSDSIALYMQNTTNKNVTFVLERNSVYFVAAEITNPDFDLRIKAEEGTGSKPLIMLKLNDETGDWPKFISTQNDVYFENLHITYEKGDKLKMYGSTVNNFGGEGKSITFKGCYMERERQAPIRLASTGMKVLIEDCRLGNIGEQKFQGGNGRAFDTRSNNADSVIIRNTTIYSTGDRLFRSMGAHINYVELDHVTSLNNLGRHGCINLSTVNKAVITNWLSIDACMLGSGRTELVTEQANFEGSEYRYLISLDDQPDGVATELEIHHNNFANTQAIKDKWESIDSLEAPKNINPLIEQIMGTDASNAFLEPEVVEFVKVPEFPYELIDTVYKYYVVGDMNNSYNGLYKDDTTVFIQNLNMAYASSYASYTAGVDGFPLGDLNWFPNQKENWLNGAGPVSAEDYKIAEANDDLINCYPNPFNTQSTVKYNLPESGKVKVSVYSTSGRLVNVLVDSDLSKGEYTAFWNGTDRSGSTVAEGTYLVVIHTKQAVDATYLVYRK